MNSKLKELKNAYKTATKNLEYAHHSYELAYDTASGNVQYAGRANYSLVRDAYNTYINARNAYEAFINLKEYKMNTTLKLEMIVKLLDEVIKEIDKGKDRYLVIDNNKLRASNKLLFEENKRLRDLTKTGVIK